MNRTVKTFRQSPGRRTAAFTIVEIMVVVAIIVVLLGIGVAVGPAVLGKGEQAVTQLRLQNLQALHDEYLSITGQANRKVSDSPPEYLIDDVNDLWDKARKVDRLRELLWALDGGIEESGGNWIAMDGWDNTIKMVPGGEPRGDDDGKLPTHSSTYFYSKGPDGKRGDYDGGDNGAPNEAAADNLYSFNLGN